MYIQVDVIIVRTFLLIEGLQIQGSFETAIIRQKVQIETFSYFCGSNVLGMLEIYTFCPKF